LRLRQRTVVRMTPDERPSERPNTERRRAEWADGSEADRTEGSRPWKEDDERPRPSLPPDAPEADVLEQSQPAELEDDDQAR
jgi:hypothetical protein